jgi:hypothetical protein
VGTSADYSAPPSWGKLKGDVTRAGHNPLTPTKAGQLLRDHIGQNGGSAGVSSGRGQLGSGGTAKQIARFFGAFAHQVADVGLAEALRQNGLQNLVGRPAQETLLGIMSLCGGTDGSIDSVDARNAFSRTMDELCENTATAADVEVVLGTLTDGIRMVELLMNFFGNYLYEQFCRIFFGQLVQKHGEQRAESFLGDILDYIKSSLRNHTLGRDATGTNWFGADGDRLSAQIMQDTLAVFES